MRAPVALLVLALAGCASRECGPPKTVRVEVPVSVPCRVAMPPAPELPTDTLEPDAPIWDQMRALRAERLRLRAHVRMLEAAVQGCQ